MLRRVLVLYLHPQSRVNDYDVKSVSQKRFIACHSCPAYSPVWGFRFCNKACPRMTSPGHLLWWARGTHWGKLWMRFEGDFEALPYQMLHHSNTFVVGRHSLQRKSSGCDFGSRVVCHFLERTRDSHSLLLRLSFLFRKLGLRLTH